ncbi:MULTISPECIES: competence type IV pilus minor pilin ComGF [unclassified Staphylococcus]|uniref:competence type IV pilus minor pilin ComGF n=2 Tax=Staphylococcus TaxID=1279 RepID=UPI0021D3DB8B|nr:MULTISPECIES: competence type IV pilus minor pilin ComGF [unclassified Staphylococcus]UXR68678.1 hypothetical protein MUA26_05680 [Staphylococcus sp. IVB6246]UXR72966.1 hypothetical protein MUA48_05935 [Staphylococcus sp. IVB6238]UXR75261.1 hypothetical protein MUA74_05995 [Staphylococcus sp. IVB6233]UXR79462.1 hypothetical protein MUA65_05600 [Staphylococcus sp. IVB6218]
MIEALLSLYIQMLVVTLIPVLIFTLINFRTSFINDDTFVQELMVKEIGHHLHESTVKKVDIHHQCLEIIQDHTKYTYQINHLKLIKQVNDQGNITVLNGVKNIQYTRLSKKNFKITISLLEGNTWIEKTFII